MEAIAANASTGRLAPLSTPRFATQPVASETDLTITRLADDRFLLLTGASSGPADWPGCVSARRPMAP
ncbi:MAG: hypothetical protein R2932_35080 [Caldilineaceae bacterium]